MVTYYALTEAPISNQTSASVRDLDYAGRVGRTVPSLHMRANGFAWEHYRLKLNEHERVQNAELANTLISAVFAVLLIAAI
jgi:hypothetical protein